jgi:hypothetical protein
MKSVETRGRQQNWAMKKFQTGLCPRCGSEQRDFNPSRGKPYRLGPVCRAKVAALQKQIMRRKRKRDA